MASIHGKMCNVSGSEKIPVKNNELSFLCLKDWQRSKRLSVPSFGKVNSLINMLDV